VHIIKSELINMNLIYVLCGRYMIIGINSKQIFIPFDVSSGVYCTKCNHLVLCVNDVIIIENFLKLANMDVAKKYLETIIK